jgi:hypothetical protein
VDSVESIYLLEWWRKEDNQPNMKDYRISQFPDKVYAGAGWHEGWTKFKEHVGV